MNLEMLFNRISCLTDNMVGSIIFFFFSIIASSWYHHLVISTDRADIYRCYQSQLLCFGLSPL